MNFSDFSLSKQANELKAEISDDDLSSGSDFDEDEDPDKIEVPGRFP